MVDYIAAFRADLEAAEPALRKISDAAAGIPLGPGKWSPKETIGHLIDSASVNHERFLRAVQSDDLVMPGYDQDTWVAVQQYGESRVDVTSSTSGRAGTNTLHHVMSNMPAEHRFRGRDRHSLDVIAFRDRLARTADDARLPDERLRRSPRASPHAGPRRRLGIRRGTPSLRPRGRRCCRPIGFELREMTAGDLPFVAEMVGDAETMRFYPHAFTPLEARRWHAAPARSLCT